MDSPIPQALEWLRVNEPVLWEFIKNEEPLDFLSFKNYSYASAQVFSHQRWTCVGEAGFFLDPLYSVGSDYIATGNTITVEMIRWERAGALTETAVETFNKLVLEILFSINLGFYRGTYRTFGHAQIFTPKLACGTQPFIGRLCINSTYKDSSVNLLMRYSRSERNIGI